MTSTSLCVTQKRTARQGTRILAVGGLIVSIILTAVVPSLHPLALIVAYGALFLCFWLSGGESLFFAASICFVFLLEMNLGLSLSSVKGLSLMNVALLFPLGYLLLRNLSERRQGFIHSPLNIPFLAIIAYVFVSMVWTFLRGSYPLGLPQETNFALYDFDGSFQRLLAEYKRFLNPFLVFFVVYQAPRTKSQVKALLSLLLAFVGLSLVLSVLGSVGFVPWISYVVVESGGSLSSATGAYQIGYRLKGLMNEPNLFASFVVLFIPAIAAAIFRFRALALRLAFLLLMFLSLLTLILTGSRGGYVGLLVSLLVFGFLLGRKKIVRIRGIGIAFAGLLVLGILVAVVFPDAFHINVVERLSFLQTSRLDPASQGRLDLWAQGLRDFVRRPLLGNGWLNGLMVHNNFLFDLATLGLVGFGIYLLIYRAIIVVLYRDLKARDFGFENLSTAGFLSGFAGFLATMAFVEVLVAEFFLYFYLGIILAFRRFKEEPSGVELSGGGGGG